MRIRAMAVFTFLAGGLPVPAAVAQAGDPSGSHLILPDGTVIPLPRRNHAFGPGGPLLAPVPGEDEPPPAPPVAPPRPAPQPRVAAEPPPPPPPPPVAEPADLAARRKARLDELYARLAQAADPVEAGAIDGLIAEALLHSGSDTADLLMQRAVVAMGGKDNATALRLLDALVQLQPGWAEAWNKRATVRYLDDDDVGAMADIGQTLALEPRHFGALSGMGLILHRNGDDKDALTVLQRAAAIDPQNPQVKQMIEQLAPAVRGQAL